jgi:hypothetical protein
MKQNRIRLTTALTVLLLLSMSLSVSAFELGATYRIGNLGFHRNRLESDTGFTGLDFPMGMSLFASHNISEDQRMKVEYSYDDILKNIVTSLFIYKGNFFSFGVGPFLGFLNTDQLWPKIGISSYFKIEAPGVIFASLCIDNSTNDQLVDVGNYIQERNSFSLGFYVPNAICSLNVIRKRFVEQKTASLQIVDLFSEYSFKTDIFQKNIPYKIILSFGLQTRSKQFVDSTPTTHSLYSLVIGTRADIGITDSITLILDLDSSIYTFGQDALLGISNPGPGGYLFRAVAGVSLDMSKLLGR